MIAIIKRDSSLNIDGWILAANACEASIMARSSNHALASYLYLNEWVIDNDPKARIDIDEDFGDGFTYTILRG